MPYLPVTLSADGQDDLRQQLALALYNHGFGGSTPSPPTPPEYADAVRTWSAQTNAAPGDAPQGPGAGAADLTPIAYSPDASGQDQDLSGLISSGRASGPDSRTGAPFFAAEGFPLPPGLSRLHDPVAPLSPPPPPGWRPPMLAPGASGQALDLGDLEKPPLQQGAQTSDAQTSLLSPEGDAWLKAEEGDSLDMTAASANELHDQYDAASQTYKDHLGNLTFGIGHKLTPGDGLTVAGLRAMSADERKALAAKWYAEDVQRAHDSVVNILGKDAVARLSPNQIEALTFSVFNAGPNRSALGVNMKNDILSGDYDAAANEFNAWHGGGKIIQGLVKRNLGEQDMWSTGTYHHVQDGDPRVQQILRTQK